MTLVIFSMLFSFLTALFNLNSVKEHISSQNFILIMLGVEIFFGIIYFILIYFCIKQKKAAKIILAILLILGIISILFTLLTENIVIAEGIFYAVCIFLDIYSLILLFSQESKQYFDSGRQQRVEEGSYKTWFSTLSSILFVIVMGAKFLNKYDSNRHLDADSQITEVQNTDEIIEDDQVLDEESATTSTANDSSHAIFEKLDCKDPDVISEFVDTINNSPSALSNNLKIVDTDTDYIEEISFTAQPYELQCHVLFTFNDSTELNYLMRIYDKNGKGKMMIEGEPIKTQGE